MRFCIILSLKVRQIFNLKDKQFKTLMCAYTHPPKRGNSIMASRGGYCLYQVGRLAMPQ